MQNQKKQLRKDDPLNFQNLFEEIKPLMTPIEIPKLKPFPVFSLDDTDVSINLLEL